MSTQRKRAVPHDLLTPEDREILERTFHIDDPALIPGLLERPPETDEVPEIEYAYNTTPPGGRAKGHAPHLKCVFPHAARHWRGSIVRWRNGDRARLGPDCGADHFGFDFKAVEERFVAARSRKADLQRFVALRELMPDVAAELSPLSRHVALVGYDQLRQDLLADFRELYEALGAIARLGGVLRTTRWERDFAAEERRVERSAEGRQLLKDCEDARVKGPGVVKACNQRLKRWMEAQQPIMREVVQDAGVLSGGGFLLDPRPLAHTATGAAIAMRTLSNEIVSHRSDYWTVTRPFSRTFKSIREAIGLIDELTRRVDEGRRLSNQANLQRVQRWTELEAVAPRGLVRQAVGAEGRTLINLDSGVRWTYPAAAGLPALPKLEELRRLLGD